jgi:hypothetical protein
VLSRALVAIALAVGAAPAGVVLSGPPGPPATLAREYRVADEGIVAADIPIDFVGVLSERDVHGGAIRFRRDGRWGPWQDLEPDGVQVPGGWASGLVAGDDADGFQVRGLGRGPAVRAIVINTTDGPVQPSAPSLTDCGDQSAIVTRCEWGADESLMTWAPEYYPPQKLTVHHTATSNGDADPASTVRAIYRYHAVDRAFGDIGYQYLIDESGAVYEGRYSGDDPFPAHDATGTNVVTAAHVGGFNSGNTGIALLGTLTSVPATPSARQALEALLRDLSVSQHIDPHGASTYVNPVNGVQKSVANISGHRDWAATECPGERLYVELPAIRDAVAGAPSGDVTAPAISGISVSTAASTATVHWSTDEAATGAVDYRRQGTSSWSPATHQGLTTDHIVVLNGLRARTTYQFRVTSADSTGNQATSPIQTFTTTRR